MTYQTMVSRHPDNNEIDFFRTPSLTTLCLLSQKRFGSKIWENACGDGAISEILLRLDYDVLSTDLYDHGYGQTGVDFLKTEWPNYGAFYDIVTNPPYNIHLEWIEKSLKYARRYVALLFPLTYLPPKNKRPFITDVCGFELIVLGWRSKFIMPHQEKPGGMKDYVWFVWDKEKPATKSFKTTIVEQDEVKEFAKNNYIDWSTND